VKIMLVMSLPQVFPERILSGHPNI
jgi:hypothetical protein